MAITKRKILNSHREDFTKNQVDQMIYFAQGMTFVTNLLPRQIYCLFMFIKINNHFIHFGLHYTITFDRDQNITINVLPEIVNKYNLPKSIYNINEVDCDWMDHISELEIPVEHL